MIRDEFPDNTRTNQDCRTGNIFVDENAMKSNDFYTKKEGRRKTVSLPTPSHHSTSHTTFNAGPGFWASIPKDRYSDVVLEQCKRAMPIILRENLPIPPRQPDWLPISGYARLLKIIQLAVEAEMLFFVAAVEEPSQDVRDEFLADFLRRALQPNGPILQYALSPIRS
jgi:hypothetical protein